MYTALRQIRRLPTVHGQKGKWNLLAGHLRLEIKGDKCEVPANAPASPWHLAHLDCSITRCGLHDHLLLQLLLHSSGQNGNPVGKWCR